MEEKVRKEMKQRAVGWIQTVPLLTRICNWMRAYNPKWSCPTRFCWFGGCHVIRRHPSLFPYLSPSQLEKKATVFSVYTCRHVQDQEKKKSDYAFTRTGRTTHQHAHRHMWRTHTHAHTHTHTWATLDSVGGAELTRFSPLLNRAAICSKVEKGVFFNRGLREWE